MDVDESSDPDIDFEEADELAKPKKKPVARKAPAKKSDSAKSTPAKASVKKEKDEKPKDDDDKEEAATKQKNK